jgi:hypothetical protein
MLRSKRGVNVDFATLNLLGSENQAEVEQAKEYCSTLDGVQIRSIGKEMEWLQSSVYIWQAVVAFTCAAIIYEGLAKRNPALMWSGLSLLGVSIVAAIAWTILSAKKFDRRFRAYGDALFSSSLDEAAIAIIDLYSDTNNRMFRGREPEIFASLGAMIGDDPSLLTRLGKGQAEYLWRKYDWMKRSKWVEPNRRGFVEGMESASKYRPAS